MKHFALGSLLYAVAVIQTSRAMPDLSIDPMICIAACVLVMFAHRPALIWITAIGLLTDLAGSHLIGVTAIGYVTVGFLIRMCVSHAHQRPLHITASIALAFTLLVSLPDALRTTEDLPGLLQVTTTVLLTWFAVTAVLVGKSLCSWLSGRFRHSSTASGAVGTPVGLQVR